MTKKINFVILIRMLNNLENKKTKVLLIHGLSSNGKNYWFAWLKEELEKHGFEVRNPNILKSEKLNFEKTLSKLEKEILDFDQNDIIIGHSLGGFFASALAEKKKIKKLILIGAGLYFNKLFITALRLAKIHGTNLFLETIKNKQINSDKIQAQEKITVLSKNDRWLSYRKNIKIFQNTDWQIKTFKNKKHFKDDTFPELIDIILS
jgi:predicted alpha/beta hydrolase family esterase